MRKQVRGNGLVLQAIAGTYVVTLGWDVAAGQQAGLLGFAVQRADHTENETLFMRGMETFPNTSPPLPPGRNKSSTQQPVQSRQRAGSAAQPTHACASHPDPPQVKP